MAGVKDPDIRSVRTWCGTCREVTEHRDYVAGGGYRSSRCLPCALRRNKEYRARLASGKHVPEQRHQHEACEYDLRPHERVCPTCFLTACDCEPAR